MTSNEARAILTVNAAMSIAPFASIRRAFPPDEASAWASLVTEAQKLLDQRNRGVLPL